MRTVKTFKLQKLWSICIDLYISQTTNSFTKRWNAHRNVWKNNITKLNHEIKDNFALIIDYKKFHKSNTPEQIKNVYTVQFLESHIRTNSDYTEQWCIKKTNAKISLNIVIKNSFNKNFKISLLFFLY